MKYRIEVISVPEYGGIAQPQDEGRVLQGHRIIHVLAVEPRNAAGRTKMRVLTEEDE